MAKQGRFLALVTAALLAATPTLAAEWVSVGKNTKGEWFVDITSLQGAGPIRRAWTKTVYRPKTVRVPSSAKWWSEHVAYEAYNCKLETNRREAFTVYFDDDTNESYSYDGSEPWSSVPPGMNAAMFKLVCSAPAPKSGPATASD